MHDDVDARRRHVEEPARLDHLETLVHQRRRVDRDLAAHLPRRMPQRVVRRHARERAASSERNGPPDAVRISLRDLLGAPAVEALMDRVVLAVDGQDRDAAPMCRVHHQRAGHHEHFLVRERDRLAGVDRREHRFEARRARRSAEHDVDVRVRRDLHEAARPGDERRTRRRRRPERRRQLRAEIVDRFRCGRADDAGTIARRLLGERRRVLPSREANDLQPIGVRVDHRQRAPADRSRRSEDRDALGAPRRRSRRGVCHATYRRNRKYIGAANR